MRELDGRINYAADSKKNDAWNGPWVMNDDDDDWEFTMAKLEHNLKANSLRVVNVGGMMRVVSDE